MAERPPICVFLSRGEYDAMHQALAIAAAAVSMGRRIELYFSWWALERLVRGNLDEPDLQRDDVNALMEQRSIPTLRQLLRVVRDSGLGTLFACSGSMAALGINAGEVEGKVDALAGWASILQRTESATERFFL